MLPSLLALGAFAVGFFLHLALWKHNQIVRSYKNLTLSFVLPQVFIFAGVLYFWDLPFYEVLYSVLLSFTLFATYLLSYPGIEADSPSNEILLAIEACGEAGMSMQEYMLILNDKTILLDRLDGLVQNRKVEHSAEGYRITAEGRLFLQFFKKLRKMYTDKDFEG